ncbi:Phytoene desaturase, partial [Pseudolycoriella hygida]
MSEKRKSVIIIGSGVGGTALAARLSHKGFDVTVYEKNSFSGGRLSLIHKNGHRFDQGPSLYLMPKLFEETYNDLGESIADHLDLLKCESNYVVNFHDGDKFELSCDLAKMYEQLKKYEGSDERTFLNFMDFMKELHYHYERSVVLALKANYAHWYDELQLRHIPQLFKMHLWDTVYNRTKRYFFSEKVRKVFTFQTMYIGMSPFDSPAPYNLLQYTELAEGIWYPRGGFHKVIESLEQIAMKKFNAKFVYEMGVEKIIVDEENVAKGVRLENGEEKFADLVVCNADLVYAYNKLLPQTSYGKRLGEKGVLTSSSISFYWGMKRKIPQLDVHNIFLAKEYQSSFDDIFKRHLLPEDPSFYLNVPSKIDPTAAPDGKETIVVLLPMGHITPNNEHRLDELIKSARAQVIERIEASLNISNFDELIETELINDPRTWQTKFNLWKGSILGLSHNILQVLHLRPATRSNLFKNLYFVGASAHPGTGVPVVLCGAKLVEKQIMEDC